MVMQINPTHEKANLGTKLKALAKKASPKLQEQSHSFAKRYTHYFLGCCVLFIVSAVAFCPVTQAALTSLLLPVASYLKLVAHLALFSLLAIGLSMRAKYQG